MNRYIKKIVLTVSVLLFLFLFSFSIHAETAKPRVTVIPLLMSDPDNIQLNIISERVTETAVLVLKHMRDFDYKEPKAPFPESFDRQTLLQWCERESIDNLVYGKTYPGADNSYIIEMSVFIREIEDTALTRLERAESVLDIFEATDNITFSLIEGFSGRHIAFGSIKIELAEVEGSFIPVIDGEAYPENTFNFPRILTGDKTLEIIQERMIETRTVYTAELTVTENQLTVVNISLPYLMPEETDALQEQEQIIDRNRDRARQRQAVIEAYESIDLLLTDIEYNPQLAELRQKYRQERAAWERAIAEAPEKEKREIIVTVKGGASAGFLADRYRKNYSIESPVSFYIDEANETTNIGPIVGAGIQIQVINNLYLQLEYNLTELMFGDSDLSGFESYVEISEIPVLFKYMLKTGIGRFSLLMGVSIIHTHERKGIFEIIESEPELFPVLSYNEPAVGLTFGLEYSYMIGRHLLFAEARFLKAKIMNYSYSIDPEVVDDDVGIESVSFSVGYGYNLGGSGRLSTEESRKKWLLPAGLGYMFDSDSNYDDEEDEASFIAIGGVLYRLTDTFYAGITGFGVADLGVPGALISLAWSKDPDKFINSVSFVVIPMMDETIWAASWNAGINRILIGLLGGGSLKSFDKISIGPVIGYYF